MLYSMVGLAGAALALTSLAALRYLAAQVRSDTRDIAAATSGLVFLASLVAAAAPLLVAAFADAGAILPPPGWQRTVLVGTLGGALVYLVPRVLLVDVLASLLLWATRRENEDRQPLATVVRSYLIHAAAASCIFTAFLGLVGLDLFVWWPLLVVLLPVAAFPIYQGQVQPWIEYRKAREIGNELPEVSAWLRETCKDGRMPRFKIRVRETNLNNAMATGGMFGHLIVVGGGLLKNMEPQELKAILAHEMAHVVNRDMLWLTLINIAGSACFIAWVNLVSPGTLLQEGGIRMAAGFGLFVIGAAITLLPLPAIFSPRLEFRADRVAATMLGDARTLTTALAKMAELTEMPMDQRTWTHPSYKARIEALERLHEGLR